MIKFYGVFQLVKVTKEGKTKDGEKMVYFTAASRRSKEDTDFKLFRMTRKNAENFINNLERKENGYKSRKLFIEGYVETYKEESYVEVEKKIKAGELPERYGEIIRDLKIKIKKKVPLDKDIYVVNHFEFLDSKNSTSKGRNVEADDIEFEDYDGYDDDDSEFNNDEIDEAAATKETKITKQKSVDIFKNNNNTLDMLDEFKDNSKFNYNNVNRMI